MQNLFLFTGENDPAREAKLKLWQREFVKKHGEVNLEIFESPEESQISRIITALQSHPFLGEKRMVLVKGLPPKAPLKENQKKSGEAPWSAVEEILTDIPETTVAIFSQDKPDRRTGFFKKLHKLATIHDFPLMKGAELENEIKSILKKSRKVITREALGLFLLLTAEDIRLISKELEKLSLLSTNTITEKEISDVVTGVAEANIFQALENVGASSHRAILQGFEDLFQAGQDRMMIFFMLVRQIRLLIMTRSLLDQRSDGATIQRRLKIAPFQTSRLVRQARGMAMPQLIRLHERLTEMDLQIKTGKISQQEGDAALFQLAMDRLLVSA